MSEVITETANLAEDVDFNEEEGPREDMSATVSSDPAAKIEFHVQMRSWTLNDMESLIIDAAAKQLVGRHAGDGDLSKAVQDAAIKAITERADKKLEAVSAEILDQPMMPTWNGKEPVTLRDFIGLYAKDYLTQVVDREGKPTTSGWGSNGQQRIVWIVERALDRKFKSEIEAATNKAIVEVREAVKANHKELVEAEMKRLRDALSKAVTPA